MYRFLTWAVGVLALTTVAGAIGYDLTTEHMAMAHAAPARSADARPLGADGNDQVDRLAVIALQPADAAPRVTVDGEGAPLVEVLHEEMGAALRLTARGAGAVAVALPADIGQALAGENVRIVVWARADRQNPAKRFALALSVDERPASWTRFEAGQGDFESYSIIVPVPAGADAGRLRVMIEPDADGADGAITVSHVIVDRLLGPVALNTASLAVD